MLGRSANDLTPLPDLLPWSDLSPLIDALNRYISRLKRMVRRQERFSADASPIKNTFNRIKNSGFCRD